MGPLTAEEKSRRARAMWAFSGKSQDDLASDAGIGYDRLRAILSPTRPTEATLDELLQIAEATGAPRDYALNGWNAVEEPKDLFRLAAAALSRLDERLRRLEVERAVIGAEETPQTDESSTTSAHPQPGQQP